MIENIRLSFQGVWSHKMRSFLTMLGIIIGIASIISIVSTIQGTNEQIRENLIGAGNNAVKIQLSRGDSTYEFDDYSSVPQGLPVITETVRPEAFGRRRSGRCVSLQQPQLCRRDLLSEYHAAGSTGIWY